MHAHASVLFAKAPSFERHFELSHTPPGPISCFASSEAGDVYYGRGTALVNYRGASTVRLGAHETIAIERLPADFAALMIRKYEQCEGVAGAVVLKLTAAERAEYRLPDHPALIASYL